MTTVAAFLFAWFGIGGPFWILPGVLLEWPPRRAPIIAWAIVGICTALLIWALDAIAEHTP